MIAQELLNLVDELVLFMREPINIGTKFQLDLFLNSLLEIKQHILKTRSEIIFAIEPSGKIEPKNEAGEINPKIKEFSDSYNKVLEQNIPVKDIPVIYIPELNFVTPNDYQMMFKHIIKKSTEEENKKE